MQSFKSCVRRRHRVFLRVSPWECPQFFGPLSGHDALCFVLFPNDKKGRECWVSATLLPLSMLRTLSTEIAKDDLEIRF